MKRVTKLATLLAAATLGLGHTYAGNTYTTPTKGKNNKKKREARKTTNKRRKQGAKARKK